MKLDALPGAEKYTKAHQRKKRWYRVVTCLACVVVFCTVYALILPAITLEKEACEIPEHTHSEACYTQVTSVTRTEPVCTIESLNLHQHEDTCYDSEGNLTCGYAGFVVHHHDSACYDENGNLWCPLPEVSAHVHGEDCYTVPAIEPPHVHTEECYARERGELICNESTEPVHLHTEECYSESRNLTCGQEESDGHSHGEGCYDENSELICTLEESAGHCHDDACYTITRETSCGMTEEPAHQHSDECYQWTENLICGLSDQPVEMESPEPVLTCGRKEILLHEHTADCYNENGALTCGKIQVLEHQHTDACFTTVEEPVDTETQTCTNTDPDHVHTTLCYGTWELTCGKEEHTHSEACTPTDPEQEPVYICGKEAHTHDETCLDENGNQVCGLEEHTHTLSCYSDPEADVETREQWEQTFAGVTLTGNWRQDVIAIAETQLGYAESSRNYAVWEDGSRHGYTRYGDWYGSPYGDWCAMFVSFCIHYAGVEDMPLNWGCRTWIADLEPLGRYRQARGEESYSPKVGDLIFYDWEGDGLSDHVGLVAELIPETENEPARLVAIEGNSANKVQSVTYDLEDPVILGYGLLPEQVFFCGKDAHTHSETCYDEAGELTCGLEEHTHSKACTSAELTEEEQARVDAVIARIEALPTSEEVEENLTAYEETGDEEGYETYLQEVSQQARTVYAYYEDLGPELQEQVTNREKLLELAWLWSAAPLAITDTVTVYQINQYSKAVTTLVSGGSVVDMLGNVMSFTYWDAIVVEKDSSGKLYVAEYETADGDKRGYQASTADGFVLLLYNTTLNVNVGDEVNVDFDYKTTAAYNSAGYGTVSFGSGLKLDKDNSDKLSIVPGADTRELIEVNLYDYGSNINDLYRSNNNYPGFQQDQGSTNVGKAFNAFQSFNFGNNITADLSAGIAGVTNAGGAINATTGGANSPISGAMQHTLGSDGYPALSDGTSLAYLFSNSAYAQKQNSQSINGLFQHNSTTGAYTFNSRENHAQFNPGNSTFTLYNQIISSNFMMYPFGNFLPFNDIVKLSAQVSTIDRAYLQTIANTAQYKYSQGSGEEYGTLAIQLNQFIALMDDAYGTGWTATDAMNKYFALSNIPRTFDPNEPLLQNLYSIDYDEPTDFFFGMEMKMNFMQPKGGITGPGNDQEMVFYFTGDDDVWVYIDGVLFLDLSGIHRHVGGKIDFVKGEVSYYGLDVSTGDVGGNPLKTVKFSDLVSTGLNSAGTFADYSIHSFNFYYMERGAGSGVCRMNFNFPLLRQNTISVTKELSVDEADKLDLLGNPDFRFQILKEDGTEPFIGSGVGYDILDTAGNKIGTGTTSTDGVFILKANQTAVFSGIQENSGKYFVRELLEPDAFQQYGKITVDGSTVTTGTDSEVIVGSDTFQGVDSPVKDISDGNTAFHFDNEISFNKMGRLEITKKLETYPQTRELPQFQFVVTLDGALLPIGTEYIVGGETRFVTEAGMIALAPDETAVISNIIAGSRFTVQETAASGAGYTVLYDGSDLKEETNESGSYVSGVIKTNAAVAVTVTNTERGAVVTIPGTKTLSNPDEAEHSFAFQLEQVTDSSGSTVVEGGTSQRVSVAWPLEQGENSAAFQFRLSYLEKDLAELPVTFYYKITEVMDSPSQVRYDPAVYIAEITVTRETDENGGTGELTAALTNLWKNGTAITDTAASFTNTLIGDLTVTKQVIGAIPPETEFHFTVTLKQGDTPLSGTFNAVKYTAADETPEAESLVFDENGRANITLRHGQSLKICGVPLGTVWSVAESDAGGYSVSYQVDSAAAADGQEGTGTLTGNGAAITFTNAVQYELPDTGGAGTMPYTAVGSLLLTGAAFLLLHIHKKRRKEDAASS